MTTAAVEYEKLVAAFDSDETVTSGQMFGKACLKVKGKAFTSLHDERLVFKLTGDAHKKAMALKDAQLWDPSGKGRPMKEWVAVPPLEAKHFKGLALEAHGYVLSSR